MCGFCDVWICNWGCVYVRVCVCVSFVMWGCVYGFFFFNNNLFPACSITLICNTTCSFYPLKFYCFGHLFTLFIAIPFITCQSLWSL